MRRRTGDATIDDVDAPIEPVETVDPYRRSAQRHAIEGVLARLPEEFRVAAVLCDVAGLTPTEAGEVLGVPVGTMKSRVFRARAQLAAMLREPSAADGVELSES